MSEEEGQTQMNWEAHFNEVRRDAIDAVYNAVGEVADPKKALWPPVRRVKMGQTQRAVMSAHINVLRYADQFRPFKDELDDVWSNEIGQIDLGKRSVTISLSSLDELAFKIVESKTTSKHELYGERESIDQYRVLLPVEMSWEVLRNLDVAMEQLGFVELKMQDYDAGPV